MSTLVENLFFHQEPIFLFWISLFDSLQYFRTSLSNIFCSSSVEESLVRANACSISSEEVFYFSFKRLLNTDVPPTNKIETKNKILFKINKKVDVILTVFKTLRVA